MVSGRGSAEWAGFGAERGRGLGLGGVVCWGGLAMGAGLPLVGVVCMMPCGMERAGLWRGGGAFSNDVMARGGA